MINLEDTTQFEDHYPDAKARFSLTVQSPLLSRIRLVKLAGDLAPHLVEFNAGDLPISVSPNDVQEPDLSATETIERIGECNSWMTLRNIEHDAEFATLAQNIIDHLSDRITQKTGDILQREAFIFISSPGAVTPFHFDEEHNILIQIEGTKDVQVYSQYDRDLASQQDLERFHTGAHRNLLLHPELQSRGEVVTMAPGDALYIPPLAPHWVKVTSDKPALSLSVTWRSAQSKRTCYLHQINHELRKRGANPRFPGEAPIADQLKIWRASAMNRLQRKPAAKQHLAADRDLAQRS